MTPIRLALRFATAVAVTLGLTCAAVPAVADEQELAFEGSPSASVHPWDPLPNDYSNLDLTVTGRYDWRYDVQVSFDTRDLTGIAELTTDSNCSHDSTVHVCLRTTGLEGQGWWIGHPMLAVASGARPGDSGVLHVTATGPTGRRISKDVTVFIGGTSLRIKPIPPQPNVLPSAATNPLIEIVNEGTLPANRVLLVVSGQDGLEFQEHFANCQYGDGFNRTAAVCTIESQIAPGETVTLDALRLGFTGDERATGARFHLAANVEDRTISALRTEFEFEPGSGPRLTFGKPETPVTAVGGPNITRLAAPDTDAGFAVGIRRDIEAVGRWAPDDDGRTGTLTVGAQNNGPAKLMSGPEVYLLLPEGATTLPPVGCRPRGAGPAADRSFVCDASSAQQEGSGKTFDFLLRLTTAALGGPVEVYARLPEPDADQLNDSLNLTLGARTATSSGAGPVVGAAAVAALIGVLAVLTVRRRRSRTRR